MSLKGWLGRVIGLTDGGFWTTFFSGGETFAGKDVNSTSAMQVAAFWACNRLLSQSGGVLPCILYRRMADGSRLVVRDHPVYDLIHNAPNTEMTAAEFWESVIACQNIAGDAFGFKQFYNDRVAGIDLLHPETVQVTRYQSTGELKYSFDFRGKAYEVGPEKMVHFRGWGLGGDRGLSVIAAARNSLSIAMAADEVAGKMFANGNFASGFIQTNNNNVLKPEQRTQFKSTLTEFVSSKNAGNYMLLEGGFEFKPLTINPDDMEMLKSRGFSVEEVCRWFLVPPFMIGHTEKNTSWGAGLEQQLIAFLTFSLMPYLNRISKRLDMSLLTVQERLSGLYTEFNIEGLLRADSAARAAFYSVMVNNGIMTRNEVRTKENMPKAPGGDLLTVQSAMVPLDTLRETAAQESTRTLAALRSYLAQPTQSGQSAGGDPPAAVH